MTRDKLDKLLKQWAAHHAINEEHARKLADRIVGQLRRDDGPTVDVAARRQVSTSTRRRMVCAALGAAVALLVMIAVVHLSRVLTSSDEDGRPEVAGKQDAPPSRSTPDSEARALSVAVIPQSEIADGRRLFQEFEELFADDLRHIVNTDTDVRLAVWPVSGGPITHLTPLLIRVLVVERNRGEASWHELMKVDLLTRSQELVEAVPEPKSDNRLFLWAYFLPDGKVAVDSSIRLAAPIRASVDVTNVLTPGEPARVFSLETEDAEYRVFQVVVPLAKHEGVPCSET